ncbi:MAG: hypothetical protein KKE16_03405 [Firmicutes bacterium]|nr:hypothetical protein [Bacillota bacterium]
MKLVVYVMNNTSKLDDFLHFLKERNIKGATILNGTGMARKLIENDDMEFIGSLKKLFDNPRVESKVILMALEDEQVPLALEAIHLVAPDLTLPNSGIVFTVPIDFIEGFKK